MLLDAVQLMRSHFLQPYRPKKHSELVFCRSIFLTPFSDCTEHLHGRGMVSLSQGQLQDNFEV